MQLQQELQQVRFFKHFTHTSSAIASLPARIMSFHSVKCYCNIAASKSSPRHNKSAHRSRRGVEDHFAQTFVPPSLLLVMVLGIVEPGQQEACFLISIGDFNQPSRPVWALGNRPHR